MKTCYNDSNIKIRQKRSNVVINDLQHEAAGMRRRLRMPDVD